MARTRGAPPAKLTGGTRVRSLDSPWWEQVASKISRNTGLVGRTLTIEELTQIVPGYPDGRRPRPRTVARRLMHVLELVQRGPGGSLGRGATYRILSPLPDRAPDGGEAPIATDRKWLLEQVERMTGGRRR